MRNLGNRLTLHSPSRGFAMELGSAVTVVLATRLSKFLSRLTYTLPFCPMLTSVKYRAPRLYHSVHHRCYRWRWSLLRHLALHQLAHGRMDLHGLVHYPPRHWYHFRLPLWHYRQCSSMGIPGLRFTNQCLEPEALRVWT